MNRPPIVYFLNDESKLSEISISEINSWIAEEPFSQPLKMLLAKKMNQQESTSSTESLILASALDSDRTQLYHVINGSRDSDIEAQPEGIQYEAAAEGETQKEILAETLAEVNSDIDAIGFDLESDLVETIEEIAETKVEEATPNEIAPLEDSVTLNEETGIVAEEQIEESETPVVLYNVEVIAEEVFATTPKEEESVEAQTEELPADLPVNEELEAMMKEAFSVGNREVDLPEEIAALDLKPKSNETQQLSDAPIILIETESIESDIKVIDYKEVDAADLEEASIKEKKVKKKKSKKSKAQKAKVKKKKKSQKEKSHKKSKEKALKKEKAKAKELKKKAKLDKSAKKKNKKKKSKKQKLNLQMYKMPDMPIQQSAPTYSVVESGELSTYSQWLLELKRQQDPNPIESINLDTVSQTIENQSERTESKKEKATKSVKKDKTKAKAKKIKKKQSKKDKIIKEANQSLKAKDEIVSELWADLLYKQGHIKEARKMYSKLSLKYPEKSTYFAAKLDISKKNNKK